MPLTPGARLGPYEVIAALGAGGMGEVYRARDTRLDRDVAITVLPSHVTFDIFLDITRDDRILIRRTTTPPAPTLAMIVNWFDHVRRVTGLTR